MLYQNPASTYISKLFPNVILVEFSV